MFIYQANNDATSVDAAYAQFSSDYELWISTVIPMYYHGDTVEEFVRLRFWVGDQATGSYELRTVNGLDSTILIGQLAQEVVTEIKTKLGASISATKYWTPVRFFLDNNDVLMKYYNGMRTDEINEVVHTITQNSSSYVGIISAIAAITLICAFILPYTSFKNFKKRQSKVIDLFSKIQKREILRQMTAIEEELEVIEIFDEAVEEKDKKDLPSQSNGRFSNLTLSPKYVFIVLIFLVLNAVAAFVVFNTLTKTVQIPTIYNVC